MARVLITGGGGFIGSNLAEGFLKRGDDVCVLDDFSTGRRENLEQAAAWAETGGGSYQLMEGDICSVETVKEAMRGRDYVLHMAAIPSVQRSVQDPVSTNAVNIGGTLNLLQQARDADVKRFVFASSSSLYGESETLPKIETMPRAPISPYGLQKLAGEAYCGLFYRLYGLPTVALRYFNVFGPRQDPNSEYSAVIPKFISCIKARSAPTIFGDGEQTRDFTFVANVVKANMLSCEADQPAFGGAYNIGCGDRISLNELVTQINELAGAHVEARHADPRSGDIRHSLAAIDHAAKYLGYKPGVGLVEGLQLTMDSM